jgi:hypothetical protein
VTVLAHHAGENVLLMVAASGVGGVSVAAAVMRAQVAELVDRIRKLMTGLWHRA